MQYWQLDKLAELAASSCADGGEAIEIGTHQGLSAIPIANAIYPVMLHVVDHWKGSSDFRPEMRERDNYSIFIDNVTDGTQGNIQVHKQDWHEFAGNCTAKISFLHLDAEHTKDEVADQIEAFLPYMASGSIMAGDDYDWPGVRDGIKMHFHRGQVDVLHNKLWWVEFK
jgi:predicted O-methyltransferase YrrM